MGALIYGPSRIARTRAIEYVRLLLAQNHPKMTSYHAQCEHKPRHAEGPFFANLLEAVGDPDTNAGTNPSKRMCLSLRIREAAARAGSGTVLLFRDEAILQVTRGATDALSKRNGSNMNSVESGFAEARNSDGCTLTSRVQGDDHACQVRDDITSNRQNHGPGWLADGIYDPRFSLSQRRTL